MAASVTADDIYNNRSQNKADNKSEEMTHAEVVTAQMEKLMAYLK